jgi:hypothetical protein
MAKRTPTTNDVTGRDRLIIAEALAFAYAAILPRCLISTTNCPRIGRGSREGPGRSPCRDGRHRTVAHNHGGSQQKKRRPTGGAGAKKTGTIWAPVSFLSKSMPPNWNQPGGAAGAP